MFGVKPLRLASFRAILEDLGDAARDDPRAGQNSTADAASGHPARLEQFGSLLSAMARGSWSFVSPGRLSHLYAEAGGAMAAEAPAAISEAEIVAGELGLRPRLTARELRRIRRKFAAANHPDRAPTFLRERATQRMIIANTLIDQALSALANR